MVSSVIDLVRRFRRGIAELHTEDTITRYRGEIGERGVAARAVPRVDEHATVRAVGEPDDIPRRAEVRERRPR